MTHRFLRRGFSLVEQPAHCPVTPESKKCRHLLYGHKPHIYGVIFEVLEKRKEVVVLHVRHWAMRAFKVDELS